MDFGTIYRKDEIESEGSKMDRNKEMVQKFLLDEIAFKKKINDRKNKNI